MFSWLPYYKNRLRTCSWVHLTGLWGGHCYRPVFPGKETEVQRLEKVPGSQPRWEAALGLSLVGPSMHAVSAVLFTCGLALHLRGRGRSDLPSLVRPHAFKWLTQVLAAGTGSSSSFEAATWMGSPMQDLGFLCTVLIQSFPPGRSFVFIRNMGTKRPWSACSAGLTLPDFYLELSWNTRCHPVSFLPAWLGRPHLPDALTAHAVLSSFLLADNWTPLMSHVSQLSGCSLGIEGFIPRQLLCWGVLTFTLLPPGSTVSFDHSFVPVVIIHSANFCCLSRPHHAPGHGSGQWADFQLLVL